jgi:hypothetical protein
MSSVVTQLAEDVAAPIERVGSRVLAKAAFLVLAFVAIAVSAVFLTVALFMVLEPEIGALNTTLAIGGIYLVAAAAFAAAGFLWGSREPREKTPAKASTPIRLSAKAAESAEKAEAPEQVKSRAGDPAAQKLGLALDQAASPLLDLLREQGMERERLALAAGVTLAKELRPWMVVGLALAVGLVMGHFAQWRAPDER